MGIVSSISSTQVERYNDSNDRDLSAVARPLKPAYAPNPTPQPNDRPPTAPAAYPWRLQQQQQSLQPQGHTTSVFYGGPRPFNSSSYEEEEDSLDLMPDNYSRAVPSASLPFQPTSRTFQSPGSAVHTHVDYCPLEMGSMRATGIILSRAVRMLEATPPAYLLMPDHPNLMPSTSLCVPPPAPPNTSSGQRLQQNVPQYPNIHKTSSRRDDMVSSREFRIDTAHDFNGPRPPTVG